MEAQVQKLIQNNPTPQELPYWIHDFEEKKQEKLVCPVCGSVLAVLTVAGDSAKLEWKEDCPHFEVFPEEYLSFGDADIVMKFEADRVYVVARLEDDCFDDTGFDDRWVGMGWPH